MTTESDLVRGNQLLRSGKLEEALAAFQKAIAYHSNFYWSYYKLGETLEKLGRLDEAVVAYRKAIDLNSKNNRKVYKLLVSFNGFISIAEYSSDTEEPIIVVEKIQDPFDCLNYVSVFRKDCVYCPFYVEKAPQELQKEGVAYVLFWITINNGIDINNTFIQWSLDAKGNYITQQQIRDQNKIQRLFSHLAFKQFPGYKELFREINLEQLKKATVDDYSFNNALIPVLFPPKDLDKVPRNISIVEYLARHPDLHNSTNHVDLTTLERAVDCFGSDASSWIGDINIYKNIQKKGDLVYFEANEIQHEMSVPQKCEFQKIEQLLDESTQRETFYRELNIYHYKNNIKHSVIRLLTGYAWCQCPFTDTILKSNKSIPVNGMPHIAYYFESLYPFFMLCYGGWCSQISAIYLPIQNTCIRLNSDLEWGNLRELIGQLLSYFHTHQDLISDYLTTSQSKLNCLLMNCNANLGHFIWQELSGLSLLFDLTNIYESLESCLINPQSRYKEHKFNPEDIFPELKNIDCIEGEENVTEITLRKNLFLFRIEDAVVSKFIPGRIQSSIANQTFGLRESLTTEKTKGKKILMINLRVHNKEWINAVEVISDFLNSLQQSVIVVYDGFENVIPTMNSIQEKVKNPLIDHVDGTALSLTETCGIVEIIDAFLVTVGSGLVIPSWIYNKPGVAHGDPAHLEQKGLWKLVAPEGYNPDVVVFLEKNEVKPLTGEAYSDYEIDADVIILKIKQILFLSSNNTL